MLLRHLGGRKREGERQRDTKRERERERDRQTDRQTDRDRDRGYVSVRLGTLGLKRSLVKRTNT